MLRNRINLYIKYHHARLLNTATIVKNVSIKKAQVQAGEREAREQERLQKMAKKKERKK